MKRYYTIPSEGVLTALMHTSERAAMDYDEADDQFTVEVSHEDRSHSHIRVGLPAFYAAYQDCEIVVPGRHDHIEDVLRALEVARVMFRAAVEAYK